MMEEVIKYITNPGTIVSFVVFVFGLGATWSNLNSRIKTLEKKTDEIDIVGIKTTLREIQKDIEWIKNSIKQ